MEVLIKILKYQEEDSEGLATLSPPVKEFKLAKIQVNIIFGEKKFTDTIFTTTVNVIIVIVVIAIVVIIMVIIKPG